MHGLTSREQLSKRQARWAQDITTEGTRSTPPTDALPRSSIINPVNGTSSINEIRDDSKILQKLDKIAKHVETVLENFHLLEKSDKTNFIPYFVEKNHIGKSNYARLTEDNIEMCVEIIGNFSGTPIIYPFGSEKDLEKYRSSPISLHVEGTNNFINGVFRKRKDGIYIIELDQIKNELPLTLSCSFDLIRE